MRVSWYVIKYWICFIYQGLFEFSDVLFLSDFTCLMCVCSKPAFKTTPIKNYALEKRNGVRLRS